LPEEYVLPDLPYDYSALEPHISGKIMELHHDKHHATYVKGANTALEQMAQARSAGSFDNVNLLQGNLAFHLCGHINHSIFWPNLSPDGGDKPDGDLAAAIDAQFGSFDAFRGQFSAAANGIQGSGWATLSYDESVDRLLIGQFHDHQHKHFSGSVPLLLLDMWEHAYYLQYQNVKADYVNAYWNVVNWAYVAERYAAAKASPVV